MNGDLHAGPLPPRAAAQHPDAGGLPSPRPPRSDHDDRSSDNDARRARARRLLRRLYLFRVVFSASWVAIIFSLSSPGTPLAPRSALVGLALGVYPALDGLATLVELRAIASPILQRLLWCNLGAGLTAAIGILWLTGSPDVEVRTFGLWAIVSGGIQLILGVLRQWSLKGQWLMIISGGGSIVAGITFAGLTGSSATGLPALAQYSIGGAVWYFLTAGWLLLSGRALGRIPTGLPSPSRPPRTP